MSLAAQLIVGLLLAILLMVAYLIFRVLRAFRFLTEKRIEVYTSHLAELHETMRALRADKALPRLSHKLAAEMDLIAPFPTMKKSGEVLQAFGNVAQKRLSRASASEISAVIQLAESELVALNVAMRYDLALNSGSGRFPNAEVFRRNRGGL